MMRLSQDVKITVIDYNRYEYRTHKCAYMLQVYSSISIFNAQHIAAHSVIELDQRFIVKREREKTHTESTGGSS